MASTVRNERLKQYLSAEQSILVSGQSYRIGNRTLTRADLSEIRKEINDLIAAGALRMRQCIQEGIEQSKLLCGIRRIDDGET